MVDPENTTTKHLHRRHPIFDKRHLELVKQAYGNWVEDSSNTRKTRSAASGKFMTSVNDYFLLKQEGKISTKNDQVIRKILNKACHRSDLRPKHRDRLHGYIAQLDEDQTSGYSKSQPSPFGRDTMQQWDDNPMKTAAGACCDSNSIRTTFLDGPHGKYAQGPYLHP